MIAIVDLAIVSPANGVPPLAVTATAAKAPASGDVKGIKWVYRRNGGGWQPSGIVSPSDSQSQFTHTYHFTVPGTYEVAVEATSETGGNRLSAARTVVLTDPATTEGKVVGLQSAIGALEARLDALSATVALLADQAALAAPDIAPAAPKKVRAKRVKKDV